MGLEAVCHVTWQGGAGEVKALLESRELILRGEIRRTVPVAAITAVAVEGDDLVLATPDGPLILTLGADAATHWARKLTTPPPTLAQKLGVSPAAPVLVIGTADDSALAAALKGAVAATPAEARLALAVVRDVADLERAVAAHAGLPPGAALWIVHGKGPKTLFGETPVRAWMRAAGFMDTKICAVSDTLSATRYNPR
ncbi:MULTISPECIES: hypothetical protein [Nitrospirillum]|uniref:Uncharacterized protein n=1 Tax=Nitrospirillum amazonense TaxID=28077 RepID=A0A560G562_9PROT|nr:hypothetical protein [Nitrospirillum amazonense]MEC4592882.1 hypothetical protein [Nitrospirillum amazonense]TWB29025.1 hypothetical protein FBZ88_104190 [Nitrospirillum amazonense]